MKITLLIPTLNEVEGMRAVIPKIRREWVDEILVIDGGSRDGTAEYAREQGLTVLMQKRKGLRNAYTEALAFVKGDVVIPFSPDGNSLPDVIPQLVAKAKEGYDMVTASRYAAGAKSEDDDIVTAFGNKMFTFVINILYGASYTDSLVMYRAWKKDIYQQLDIDKDLSFSERHFYHKAGAEPLLSIRAAKRRLKCIDIPGDEPRRIGGVRKLQVIRGGLSILFVIFREIFYWK